ncbi:MAG: hypothetical protein KAW93_01455 [Methanogenium sp.]|nr:hypothetical protein [Methanogenium sp.]
MDLEFANNKIRKLCRNEKSAIRDLGETCSNKLKSRISDILAAETVTDLIAGKPHPLKGKRKGQYSIEISGGKRIIFVPANNPTPLTESEKIDWPNVTKIKIIEIVDYHD